MLADFYSMEEFEDYMDIVLEKSLKEYEEKQKKIKSKTIKMISNISSFKIMKGIMKNV